MKSSAMTGGFFVPTFQFRKLEIHKVFLRCLNFDLCHNLSPRISCRFNQRFPKRFGAPSAHNGMCRPERPLPSGVIHTFPNASYVIWFYAYSILFFLWKSTTDTVFSTGLPIPDWIKDSLMKSSNEISDCQKVVGFSFGARSLWYAYECLFFVFVQDTE